MDFKYKIYDALDEALSEAGFKVEREKTDENITAATGGKEDISSVMEAAMSPGNITIAGAMNKAAKARRVMGSQKEGILADLKAQFVENLEDGELLKDNEDVPREYKAKNIYQRCEKRNEFLAAQKEAVMEVGDEFSSYFNFFSKNKNVRYPAVARNLALLRDTQKNKDGRTKMKNALRNISPSKRAEIEAIAASGHKGIEQIKSGSCLCCGKTIILSRHQGLGESCARKRSKASMGFFAGGGDDE